MENSILKIFGSVDGKITPDFCSQVVQGNQDSQSSAKNLLGINLGILCVFVRDPQCSSIFEGTKKSSIHKYLFILVCSFIRKFRLEYVCRIIMKISSEILLPLLTHIHTYFMKIIINSMLTEYFFYQCPKILPVFFFILLHGSLFFQCLFQYWFGQLFFRESPSTK